MTSPASTRKNANAKAATKAPRKGVEKPAENVVDMEMSTGADSHMGLRLGCACSPRRTSCRPNCAAACAPNSTRRCRAST